MENQDEINKDLNAVETVLSLLAVAAVPGSRAQDMATTIKVINELHQLLTSKLGEEGERVQTETGN